MTIEIKPSSNPTSSVGFSFRAAINLNGIQSGRSACMTAAAGKINSVFHEKEAFLLLLTNDGN